MAPPLASGGNAIGQVDHDDDQDEDDSVEQQIVTGVSDSDRNIYGGLAQIVRGDQGNRIGSRLFVGMVDLVTDVGSTVAPIPGNGIGVLTGEGPADRQGIGEGEIRAIRPDLGKKRGVGREDGGSVLVVLVDRGDHTVSRGNGCERENRLNREGYGFLRSLALRSRRRDGKGQFGNVGVRRGDGTDDSTSGYTHEGRGGTGDLDTSKDA